jgi:hypothetical protein
LTAEPLDLGRVRVQEAFPWTVTIKNPGLEPVQVYELLSSCSCTKLEPRSFIVPPEGSVDVQMTIDLTTTDPEVSTRAERPFTVELLPLIKRPNGITRLRWDLYGTVESAIAMEPTQLVFPETLIRGMRWESRSIAVHSLEPVETITAQCDPSQASIEVFRVQGLTDAWELRVTPMQALLAGLHNFTIQLHTTLATGEQIPGIPFPVSVNVVDDIQFWPSVVLLSARMEAESVTLRSRTNRSFQVVSATSSAPDAIQAVRIEQPGHVSSVSNWLVALATPTADDSKPPTHLDRRAAPAGSETNSASVTGAELAVATYSRARETGVRFVVRYEDERQVAITLPVQYIEPSHRHATAPDDLAGATEKAERPK